MKGTNQLIDEAVDKTLDRTQRRVLIDRGEKILPFSRLVLLCFGIIALGGCIVAACTGEHHIIGTVVATTSLLYASYGIASLRLIQLKIEDKKDKCEQQVGQVSSEAAPSDEPST